MPLVFAMVENCTFRFQRSNPDADGFHLNSCLKVCPLCDRVWAKMRFEGAPASAVVHSVPCAYCDWDCIHKSGVPGSLLECGVQNRVDWDLLEHLPAELLNRELLLTIKAIK